MSKFLKLGATALAMALSITMLAPISANAYYERKYVKDGNHTYTEYSDSDTKKTISDKDYVISEKALKLGRLERFLAPKVKQITISTKSYGEEITLVTSADVKKFENFKSNKKSLKVRVVKKSEETFEDPGIDYDVADLKNKNMQYKDVNGDIQTVSYADAAQKLPKNSAEGKYTIRLYAKKAGSFKLKYTAVLENGTSVEKSIKVIAREDGNAVKSVKFAGQEVYYNTALMNDVAFDQKGGLSYTTKKSGKLQVTMNKDFKLKKIEVGTISLENYDKYEKRDYVYDYDDGKKRYKSEDGTIVREKEDDAGNVVSPTWKKVKNGKKIKLSKVNNNEGDRNTTTYWPDGTKKGTKLIESKETTAVTIIRVTYYDKKNKITRREEVANIGKLINK
ncbi:hypothetical protein [Butyrivibrio sp. XPD2002]|uniref:hypothetical protein n=1 Tax=Butyrivibrio sp. XPD2002 TaxID=1280665 RepID=UPI00040DD38F|nr:hypothetical protein [Butyrivibrio sp. XPD2002]